MLRLWRGAPWSRNPLMGGFHRLEIVAVAVTLTFVLLMIPVAAAIGTVYYANSSERAQSERDTRQRVVAVLLEDSRPADPDGDPRIPRASDYATAHWSVDASNTPGHCRLPPARRPVRKSPCGSTPTRCPRPRRSPGLMPDSTASRSRSRCGSSPREPPSPCCTSCTGSAYDEGWRNGTGSGKRPITGRRGNCGAVLQRPRQGASKPAALSTCRPSGLVTSSSNASAAAVFAESLSTAIGYVLTASDDSGNPTVTTWSPAPAASVT